MAHCTFVKQVRTNSVYNNSLDIHQHYAMCLVPVFILEMHNQTNNKSLPKTDNASSSIKTSILTC